MQPGISICFVFSSNDTAKQVPVQHPAWERVSRKRRAPGPPLDFTDGMPKEWWCRHGPMEDLFRLIESLYQRRSSIRDLIVTFRNSTRNPFPNWASS
jgi:hypothetical protein